MVSPLTPSAGHGRRARVSSIGPGPHRVHLTGGQVGLPIRELHPDAFLCQANLL